MLLDNRQYISQLKTMIEQSDVPWDELDGKSVLISGQPACWVPEQ